MLCRRAGAGWDATRWSLKFRLRHARIWAPCCGDWESETVSSSVHAFVRPWWHWDEGQWMNLVGGVSGASQGRWESWMAGIGRGARLDWALLGCLRREMIILLHLPPLPSLPPYRRLNLSRMPRARPSKYPTLPPPEPGSALPLLSLPRHVSFSSRPWRWPAGSLLCMPSCSWFCSLLHVRVRWSLL